MDKRNFSDKNFINRELSWIEFNKRVLEEAQDSSNPLFERLKFLSIVSSNLDEFFMVRVASLIDQIIAGFNKEDYSGLAPKDQLSRIAVKVHKMVTEQYNCYNRSIIPALKKEKVNIVKANKLTQKQKEFLQEYYIKNIYPVLTPMVVDSSRPFPLILNKSLNIAVILKNDKEKEEVLFATIQVPSVLARFIELPSENEDKNFILLGEVIKIHIKELFNGHDIVALGYYRITRNADLDFEEEEAEDLLEEIQQSIKKRKWGAVVRLEVEQDIDSKILEVLKDELEIDDKKIYDIHGPLDLTFLMKLVSIEGFEHLRYPKLIPQKPIQFLESEDIFQAINSEDIMIQCPYEAFDPVVELVKKASEDTKVLAIKQTLYRVSGNSPIIAALARAAENGKQVTVLVELKARFDEENNIIWAQRLEKSGCHVIYGLLGLKTHCKALLIVRKEEGGIKRYVHLSTGNYNDVTAKLYTDISIFTSNPYFGADASALFNMLSGYSKLDHLYKFTIAPIGLREKCLSLIKRERDNASNGKQAKIIVKMNSLVDQEIIEALYEASITGVEIDLIVRGICCLRPGVKGLSEKIKVRSIIGRFLEHSRICYFYNNGDEEIYLSSADWMYRNLDKRVELLFPIEDERNKKRIKSMLQLHLKDTVKARVLNEDGSYNRLDKRGKEKVDSQQCFYSEAINLAVAITKEDNNESEFVVRQNKSE